MIARVGALAGGGAVLLDSACLGPQDFTASACQREKSLDGRQPGEYPSAGIEGLEANRASQLARSREHPATDGKLRLGEGLT